MEASFRSRLDRTFGFLNGATNDGAPHLWSVEERAASMKNEALSREGESDDDDEVSGFADFLKSENSRKRLNSSFFGEEDLEDLESEEDEEDDGDGDEEEQMRFGKKKKGGGEQTQIEAVNRASDVDGPLEPSKDDEEREVREMVGMDCTLDFEDEEDEYDKVAVGIEGLHDRMFMSQVRDFGASRQQLNPLPTSFIEMRQASRDRRANHKAALARLEEDDREAATRAAKESSQATEEFKTEEKVENPSVRQDNVGEAMDVDGDGRREEPMQEVKNETVNLVSSLVREGHQRKPGKRVKFSVDETPSTRIDDMTIVVSDPVPSCASTRSAVLSTPNRYSKVPDYVKNPSKYIHYTLDWSEEDEEQANMAAFRAARVVSSSTQDMISEEESQGPSGSTRISFNPLVKRSSKEPGRGAGKGMGAEGVSPVGVVNIAANFDMDSNLGGLITVENDSTSSGSIGQGKSGRVVRRYRNRPTDDIETD